eukprot:scaffold10060_cov30-Tisochrysis_lutea.AAC.4
MEGARAKHSHLAPMRAPLLLLICIDLVDACPDLCESELGHGRSELCVPHASIRSGQHAALAHRSIMGSSCIASHMGPVGSGVSMCSHEIAIAPRAGQPQSRLARSLPASAALEGH